MLTNCPECKLQVSDKAAICPHCGYPISPAAKNITRKPRKRMRLPNGFGQISEIKNRNLRKPFRAMVTVGKDEYGKPIPKPLKPDAYFRTYNEAYEALVEYHKNPYNLESSLTMQELYDLWFEQKSSDFSVKTIGSYKSAWKYCSAIYNVEVRSIRLSHLIQCMEEGTIKDRHGEYHTAPRSMKMSLKTFLSHLYTFAMERDLVERNIADALTVPNSHKEKSERKPHIAFTEVEMNIIWGRQGIFMIDMLLVQCYSGWRPQELCELLLEKVNLEERWFRGGMKTPSGYDRIVPIHPRIYEIVKKCYENSVALGSEYLFNEYRTKRGRGYYAHPTYSRYSYAVVKITEELNLNPEHKAHDGRKHFVTMAKKYNVDEYAIKRIVGHKIDDVTESVYTERDVSWLMEEICKIP